MSDIEPGDYRHYRGSYYRVLGVARHSETEEELVVYRQLYGELALWVRPAAMFVETVTVDGQKQPRFTPLAAPYHPRLAPARHAQAREFLATCGRGLERAAYAYHFSGGTCEEVLRELAAFQNDDGGFGHGLEPDLQTPQSSVLATTVALQNARAVRAPVAHPLVRRAVGYLMHAYDHAHAYWPIIPDQVDDAPHAPWWQSGAAAPAHAAHYVFNPGAEVVAYLWAYPGQTAPDVRRHALDTVLHALDARGTEVEMHELLCLLRLLETPEVPDEVRTRLAMQLTPIVARAVATEPAAWRGYGLQPLDVAPSPADRFAAVLGDPLDLNLIYRQEQQDDLGAWRPAWSWGDQFGEAWPAAYQAWSSVLTLQALRTLDAYDRLESVTIP